MGKVFSVLSYPGTFPTFYLINLPPCSLMCIIYCHKQLYSSLNLTNYFNNMITKENAENNKFMLSVSPNCFPVCVLGPKVLELTN